MKPKGEQANKPVRNVKKAQAHVRQRLAPNLHSPPQPCDLCLRGVNVKPVRKHRKFTCKSAFCMRLGGDASVLSPLPLCATSPPRHFRSSQTLAAYSDFAPQDAARRHILRRFIVSCAPCCCEFSADRLPSEGLSQKHTYRAKKPSQNPYGLRLGAIT